MDVALYPPMPTRPCRFCLTFQGGSVFADFDVDPDARVFAVRVSFDGYGCCRAPEDVGRMNVHDSAALLAMVERGSIGAGAEQILRAYFQHNRETFWSDALAHHDLLETRSCSLVARGDVIEYDIGEIKFDYPGGRSLEPDAPRSRVSA